MIVSARNSDNFREPDCKYTLLFVPGIEHENGDVQRLQHRVRDIATIVTIDKSQIGFRNEKRNEWDGQVITHLTQAAAEHNVDGLIGHSFGCHRTLRMLQNGVGAKFALLLNPTLNTIDAACIETDKQPKLLTGTHAEQRLWPLVLDITDPHHYLAFMKRHAEHEQMTHDLFKPWHKTEFRTLSHSIPLPNMLRSVQTTVPIHILRSTDDPWDIKDWGEQPQNVHIQKISKAGHYLAESKTEMVNDTVRFLITNTIQLQTDKPSKESKTVTKTEPQWGIIS